MILRKKYFLFILAFAICLPKISSGAYEETAYSLAGYRIGFSNAKGKETIFDVDKMGRITKITNPISHETAFSYDLSGNLATKTNALEEVTGYSYDSMNRVTNIVHESEEKADFEYNLAGNLTSKNTKSTKNVFVYDSMGRIIQSSNSVLSVSSVVNYTYDLNGNRTSLTVGDLSVDYSYNSENLTTNLAFSVSSVSSVVNYSYDDALRLSTISYDNGVNGAFDYDAENRVTGFTYKTNNTAFIDHTIIRNEQGFKTHQLIDAGLIPLLPANQRKISTYNDFDQLTSEQIQTDSGWIDTDYTWNANGCLTTVENEQTYDYDYNNRLVETTKGADSAEYLYDASGARVARIFTDSTSSTTNFFIIDYTDSLKRPLAETDADGNIIRYYIWNGFMLLAHIDIIENQNPSVVYYHQDELGNTLALTNSDGEVTDLFAYMPYGTTRHQPTSFSTFNIHNSAFLWLGGYGVFYEPELDIHLTVHRAYSANLRRFISPDPLGIDAFPNLYAYANMNPLAFIDPWGLCAERGYMGEVGQVFLGYGDAAVSFGKGIWQLAAQPVASINGIEYTIMHPGQTWNNVKTDYVERWNSGSRGMGSIAGEALITILTIGAGYSDDVGNFGRIGNTTSKIDAALPDEAVGLVKRATKTTGKGNYLYQKVGATGEHMKYGITKTPTSRYTKQQLGGGKLRILAEGSKKEMLSIERSLHKTLPIGPEEGQLFYIHKQIQQGLNPPPYGK